MIEARQIQKQFKIPVVKKGRFSGIRTLFSREYIIKEAVKEISFTIKEGDFVGYIGPNGAGKSTTIKMLTGILHPTQGEVKIMGLNPHKERRKVVRHLGVVFGQRTQLWWDLPVIDSYDILTVMYKLDKKETEKRLSQLTELLGLHEFIHTPVRKLSLGQRMRADIAASLLHDPEILFFDEPTIGLDVIAKKKIRGLLKTLNKEMKKTVLLTTHDMDDIEQLCEKVIVINDGQIVYNDSIPQLRNDIGLPTIMKVSFVGDFQTPTIHHNMIQIIERTNSTITIQYNRHQMKAMDVLNMMQNWGEIEDIHMDEPQLEEMIQEIYQTPEASKESLVVS
ncbi:ABC transporter ATP-binding protein [Chengkuizengella axinellae]|uniref:ATP-binding cassette domain-containing protein n=1 Tax=Chengkuizengella axinellae TaxID=3064388 RepID=A0ABT9IZY0_9BACL|nr:ATP-binding cassette domain-containing protein [Chengkuizengella sp. 2205SS18-9]MDP5274921.1 ATP-binding cassette domain-containing protein [Chengkuizengella sp. 2205SS18-9]